MRPAALAVLLLALACATPPRPKMGVLSDLSRVDGPIQLCEHRVPAQVCTRHHPELIPRFQAVNDWCGEHGVPESQCLECHPELTFAALPTLSDRANLAHLSRAGEDVLDLRAAAVPGKVTVFDFFADWCAPCREVDAHLFPVLNARANVAVRKLNVVDWDTPLAKRYLSGVEGLPFLIVVGRDGREVRRIQGFKLADLDAAIAEGSAR